MVNIGTDDEVCVMRDVRFAMADLKGSVIKRVTKEEIVIQLAGYRSGDLIHIHPSDDGFQYSTCEGGKC